MTIWVLEMEDLTHLGGPMGSEYTTSLGTEVFSSREAAVAFAEKKAKQKAEFEHAGRDLWYWDARWIGFDLSKREPKG